MLLGEQHTKLIVRDLASVVHAANCLLYVYSHLKLVLQYPDQLACVNLALPVFLAAKCHKGIQSLLLVVDP